MAGLRGADTSAKPMKSTNDKIMEWRGKNVDDMTKAELIEALIDMQQLLQETVNQSIQDKQTLMGLIR